jgi:hypothetical protein
MSAIFEAIEAPAPLSICPKCGRQVRLDGHCDCEALFIAEEYPRPKKIESGMLLPAHTSLA